MDLVGIEVDDRRAIKLILLEVVVDKAGDGFTLLSLPTQGARVGDVRRFLFLSIESVW